MWRREGKHVISNVWRSINHPTLLHRAGKSLPAGVVGVALLTVAAAASTIDDSHQEQHPTPPPSPVRHHIMGLSIASDGKKMQLTRRFTRRKQKKFHRFVIVGSGTAAHAAIEAIRQEDPEADILVLSDENALPRMEIGENDGNNADEPISVALMETYNEWRRHITARLEDEPNDATGLSRAPLTLLLDKKPMQFDVEKNRIFLGDGTEIRYEKCLIASSGKPRHFYVLDSDRISYSLKDRINTCTTLHDFEQLDQLNKRPEIKSIMVVGGGFLGTEVATALATDPRNKEIKTRMVFVESAPASGSLPPYLAQELTKKFEAVGIEVIPDHLITSLKSVKDKEPSEPDSIAISALGMEKQKLFTDYVVLASTHTDPNFRFARESCFEIDDKNGGIVVNAQLEAISSLFVAGNAASYYDPYLGRRRVDRYDHAVNSGLVAGSNMVHSLQGTGKMKIYRHQPMFRCNLSGIDVLIEGIGEIDSSLRTVGVWVQEKNTARNAALVNGPTFRRGVVYYLKGNKIMGILLWNASDVLESARQLMLSRPEIHDNVEEELKHIISLAPPNWLQVVST